jgi:hypothetical protein
VTACLLVPLHLVVRCIIDGWRWRPEVSGDDDTGMTAVPCHAIKTNVLFGPTQRSTMAESFSLHINVQYPDQIDWWSP